MIFFVFFAILSQIDDEFLGFRLGERVGSGEMALLDHRSTANPA
jgi:hypothetical protein